MLFGGTKLELVPIRGEQRDQMQVSCPQCSCTKVVKKGKQKTKHGATQRYHCTECNTTFTYRTFPGKTYQEQLILDTLSTYNKGYTLSQTTQKINKQYKTHITPSTIHRWIHEHKDTCTYSHLRTLLQKNHPPENIITSKTFLYKGLAYNFKYHTGKLAHLGADFPTLISYIKRFEHGCPAFFQGIQERCSKHHLSTTPPQIIGSKQKPQRISTLAALALSGRPASTARHSHVETFLLINDNATIAVEVPVWFWEKQPGYGIAGHIDLIQINDDHITILDYKPDACKQNLHNVISQLYLYARGLSFRTNISLDKIRCAWFDEHDFYEFEPKQAIMHQVHFTSPITLIQS
jgi:transposase-like protein